MNPMRAAGSAAPSRARARSHLAGRRVRPRPAAGTVTVSQSAPGLSGGGFPPTVDGSGEGRLKALSHGRLIPDQQHSRHAPGLASRSVTRPPVSPVHCRPAVSPPRPRHVIVVSRFARQWPPSGTVTWGGSGSTPPSGTSGMTATRPPCTSGPWTCRSRASTWPCAPAGWSHGRPRILVTRLLPSDASARSWASRTSSPGHASQLLAQLPRGSAVTAPVCPISGGAHPGVGGVLLTGHVATSLLVPKTRPPTLSWSFRILITLF